VAQNDIKKVLAYSTISQLGFMVAAVGMGAYVAGMFHLITHAFFKALLFLSSGAVIQGVEFGHHHAPHNHESTDFDPQDMRNMGGLAMRMPTTFKVYVIGALALAGIPPLAGFFSKDEIVAFASKGHPFILVLLLAAAFLTAFYMGRQVWMVFAGQPRSEAAAGAVEAGNWMKIPLLVLAGLAILGGLINLPGLEPLGKWLEHTIEGSHSVAFSWITAGIAVVVALSGIASAWLLYGRKTLSRLEPDPLRKWIGPFFQVFEKKWWVDEIYDFLLLTPFKDIAAIMAKPVDQGLIDGMVNGSATVTQRISGSLRKLNNGLVRAYAFFILVGLAAILGILILK
jgi:NADH-quinone oxidoreductase subunit L